MTSEHELVADVGIKGLIPPTNQKTLHSTVISQNDSTEPFYPIRYPFGDLESSVGVRIYEKLSTSEGRPGDASPSKQHKQDLTIAPLSPSRSPKRSASSPSGAMDSGKKNLPMIPALEGKRPSGESGPRAFLQKIPDLSFMLSSKLSLPKNGR